MTPRNFFTAWLLGTCLLVGLVAAVNLAIDPYFIFDSPRIAGLNRDKPQAILLPRLAKTYLLERQHPKTLLLGSSRVDVGFDPEGNAWPEDRKPVFNLGIPGADFKLMYRFLQDALSVSQPDLVIIGLGLEECLVMQRPRVASADRHAYFEYEGRLRIAEDGGPNPGMLQARLEDIGSTLFSLKALGDSIHTIAAQGDTERATLSPLGYNSARDFIGLTRSDGAAWLVEAKDREKIGKIVQWAKSPKYDLEWIRKAVKYATDRHVRVILSISPGYEDEPLIYREASVWAEYTQWKRDLAALVREFDGEGRSVTLWDFSGLSPYVTGRVPAVHGEQMTWFWETDHFKPSLGDMVVARLFGGGPADFGQQLTPDTLPAREAAEADLWNQFQQDRAEDIARVRNLFPRTDSGDTAR